MTDKKNHWVILRELPEKTRYCQREVEARCEAPQADGSLCGHVRTVRRTTIERGESTCCGCVTRKRRYNLGGSVKACQLYRAADIDRSTFYLWLRLYGVETTLQKIREKVSGKVAKELGL